jgi:hypothetical protein
MLVLLNARTTIATDHSSTDVGVTQLSGRNREVMWRPESRRLTMASELTG